MATKTTPFLHPLSDKVIYVPVTKAASSASSALIEVAHDLSFTPYMAAFVNWAYGYSSLWQPMPLTTPEVATTGAGLVVLSVLAQVDDTNIYVQALTPNTGTVHSYYTSALSIMVKCFLSKETMN
jgi:hypothetical protein